MSLDASLIFTPARASPLDNDSTVNVDIQTQT